MVAYFAISSILLYASFSLLRWFYVSTLWILDRLYILMETELLTLFIIACIVWKYQPITWKFFRHFFIYISYCWWMSYVFMQPNNLFSQDAAGEIIGELQGRPDLIIGNYSDGNIVASLLSHKMGVTQVKPYIFVFSLWDMISKVWTEFFFSYFISIFIALCNVLTVQYSPCIGENQVSRFWYLLEKIWGQISLLVSIFSWLDGNESCWFHHYEYLPRDSWNVSTNCLFFQNPMQSNYCGNNINSYTCTHG